MNNSIITFAPDIELKYFNPILYLNYDQFDGPFQNMYIFIAKCDEWANSTPTCFYNSPKNIKNLHKNIIAIKKILTSDICPVIERINWQSNTYYDSYSDNIDMFQRDENNKLIKKFYVKNKFDQVFKCLYNSENSSNTVSILNIVTDNNYKSITHVGGTYEIGSYVTINNVSPSEYNGTYKVISSTMGMANVAYGNSGSYIISTSKDYISGGSIKYAELTSDEPIFDVGLFDKNYIVKTSDGYKWKYIYTIDSNLKLNFCDDNWIPVPIQINNQNPQLSDAKFGSIDVINVYDGGSGYSNGVGTVELFVDGDGDGASGDVYVENGAISDIILSNYGSNYTTANVYVLPAYGHYGSGAELTYSISPIGGHGFNYIKEFGCKDIIISTSIEKNYNIPNDITYYQVGLMYNPYTQDNKLANTTFYNTMLSIIVSDGIIDFQQGEVIYQGLNLEESTFNGNVVSFANNMLYVINTTGTPTQNYSVVGESSKANRIINKVNYPEIIPYSGTICYINNNSGIERNPLDSEQIRILISY